MHDACNNEVPLYIVSEIRSDDSIFNKFATN